MTTRPLPSERSTRLLWLVRAFVLAGAAFAGYLWWLRAGHAAHPGCHASGDCSYLWFSSWGSWFGIPISALALVPYLLAGLGTVIATRKGLMEMGRALLAGVAAFLPLVVVWFILLQGLLIKHWCRLCLVSHGISLVLSVLIFLWLRAERQRAAVGEWFHGRACITGFALALMAVAGHSVSGHRADEAFKPIPRLTVIQRASPDRVMIFEREVDVQKDGFIVSGTSEAREVMVVLADYTCPDCRRLHAQMQHVLAAQPGRYLEVVLPVPLSSKCNPAVTFDNPDHDSACELARIACVISRRRPDVLPEFHHWLMTGNHAPDLTLVRQRAQALLGAVKLESELADPANFAPLGLGLWVFQTNLTRNRLASLPVTMTSKGMFIGAPHNAETWITKLD